MAAPKTWDEYRNQTRSLVTKTYDILQTRGFLVDGANFVWPEGLEDAIPRLSQTENIVKKKHELFLNNPKDIDNKTYKERMAEFGLSEDELIQDMFEDALHFMNSCFEVSKMFLVAVLDNAQLGINENSTYGKVVSAVIDAMFPKESYQDGEGKWIHGDDKTWKSDRHHSRELFQVHLRNIVAHEKWKFENQQFSCTLNELDEETGQVNQVPVIMPYGDIMGEISSALIYENEITGVYLRRFNLIH